MEQGMMSSMPQEGVQPQGGMMAQEASPLPSQEDNNLPPYNGVVDFEGEKFEVVDGSFEAGGETYFVADDGSMVMTSDRDLIGRIENGVFVEVDDAQIAYLKDLGMIEE